MARYEIWLTTDTGVRIALLDDVLWLQATRTVGQAGAFNLGLKPAFDTSLIQVDRMIQVWRAPTGGRLALWRPYFVRRWRYATVGSTQALTIGGPDVNDLLRRRIVAFASGESEADKTDYADDMMKEIVDENAISCATTARNWSDLSVAGELGDGPSVTYSFPWRRLDYVFRDINKAALTAGTEVFWDIVPVKVSGDSISLEFRTYTGQPGRDRTGDLEILFDQQRGNLEDPYLEYDYTAEVNYVYALGQGEGTDREKQESSDTDRINASAWNRCEGYEDARNEDTSAGVLDAADAALAEGRPRRRFGAKVLDTEGVRFGRDWDYGDKVRARYRGQEFDCIVRSVQLYLSGEGEETVQARLDYED